jgi:hypothetical protein
MKAIAAVAAILTLACEPAFVAEVRIDEDCPAGIPVVELMHVDSLTTVGTLNPLCPYAYINEVGDTVVVRPLPELNP